MEETNETFAEIAQRLSDMPDWKLHITLMKMMVASVPGKVNIGRGKWKQTIDAGDLVDDMIVLEKQVMEHTGDKPVNGSITRYRLNILSRIVRSMEKEAAYAL